MRAYKHAGMREFGHAGNVHGVCAHACMRACEHAHMRARANVVLLAGIAPAPSYHAGVEPAVHAAPLLSLSAGQSNEHEYSVFALMYSKSWFSCLLQSLKGIPSFALPLQARARQHVEV